MSGECKIWTYAAICVIRFQIRGDWQFRAALSDFKTTLPPPARRWLVGHAAWVVDVRYYRDLNAWAWRHFDRVEHLEGLPPDFEEDVYEEVWQEPRQRRQETRQDRQQTRGPADAYATLHLLSTAPSELVTAAYRVLAKLNHPDHGGDTTSMQRINAAYETLRKENH